MFKKNIIHTLICMILVVSTMIVAQQPLNDGQLKRQSFNFADMKMPQLSDAEIKEALQLLGTLSPEELEKLAKFGEEVIQEAESQGLDAREIFGLPSDEELQKIIQEAEQEVQPTPTTPTVPTVEVPQTEEKITQPIASKIELLHAREMLNTIIDRIEEISQKAEIDRKTRDMVNQMSFLMNDIVSYLHILEQDNLTKYLFEKESAQLYQQLKNLERMLNNLVPQFDLPESFYEGTNPYTVLGLAPHTPWVKTNESYQKLLKERDPFMLKKQWQQVEMSDKELSRKIDQAKKEYAEYKEAYSLIYEREKSLQAFEQIVQILTQTAFQEKLFEHIKDIIKRYEPEALKLKERQEKLEAQTRKDQEEALKRRPPYTPMLFEPPIPSIPEPYTEKPSVYTPSTITGKNSEDTSAKTTKPEAPDKEHKIDKKDKKEEKDKNKKRSPMEFGNDEGKEKKSDAKINKRIENIEKEIKGIARFIDQGEPDIPAPRILFKDFNQFIKDPIPPGNNPHEPELIKTKQINAALTKMNTYINNINNELWDIRTLTKEQQHELLKSVRELVYKSFPFTDKIKELLKVHFDPATNRFIDSEGKSITMNKEKSYVYLGKSFPEINDENHKLIKELNKNPGSPSALETFSKSWRSLRKRLTTK